jgi:anti-anti-sigma regulatory factor
VGGDLYDVVRLGEQHLAFYLADATGHGVTSAMLSVLFKQRLVLVDPATGLALPPAQVLDAVNRSICEAHAAPGLFLTAVFGLLDTSDSSLTLASAGHPPVLHAREGRPTSLIRRTGPALGLAPDAHFRQERLQLLAGDRILLYTDGLLPTGSESDLGLLQQVLANPMSGAQEMMAQLHAGAHETALAVLDGGRRVVLDLSRCEYMDSTWLGTVHELVARGGVVLSGVTPAVRAMFEELSMEQVQAAIREDIAAAPEFYALGTGGDDLAAVQKRILKAHEALSALSDRNREEFSDVVQSLRTEQDGVP